MSSHGATQGGEPIRTDSSQGRDQAGRWGRRWACPISLPVQMTQSSNAELWALSPAELLELSCRCRLALLVSIQLTIARHGTVLFTQPLRARGSAAGPLVTMLLADRHPASLTLEGSRRRQPNRWPFSFSWGPSAPPRNARSVSRTVLSIIPVAGLRKMLGQEGTVKGRCSAGTTPPRLLPTLCTRGNLCLAPGDRMGRVVRTYSVPRIGPDRHGPLAVVFPAQSRVRL